MALSLIKLSNGTELLGETRKTAAGVLVTDPLQINYKFVSFQPMPTISVSRYMPFAQEPAFTFMSDQIVHMVQPREAVVEYYYSSLTMYKQMIDQHIDEELLGVVERTESKTTSTKDMDELYSKLLERMEVDGPAN